MLDNPNSIREASELRAGSWAQPQLDLSCLPRHSGQLTFGDGILLIHRPQQLQGKDKRPSFSPKNGAEQSRRQLHTGLGTRETLKGRGGIELKEASCTVKLWPFEIPQLLSQQLAPKCIPWTTGMEGLP